MTDARGLVDLLSSRLGGEAVLANDEFFAPKENLVKPEPARFIEGKYTDRGKWMDGWETRRRREPGHDWCLLRLGLPGRIHRIVVDTSHFRGNHPESCSVEAIEAFPVAARSRGAGIPGTAEAPKDPDPEALLEAKGWTELVPRTPLEGHAENGFDVEEDGRFTHLRLHIYPDGGVARLRALGEALPDWERLAASGEPVDLVAVENGGTVLACSDEFFGRPLNLLMPGPGAGMHDGWETRRRRGPGHDWVVIRLGGRGAIERAEVDTRHFKGNYPAACSLEGCDAPPFPAYDAPGDEVEWEDVLPRTELGPDAVHVFERELSRPGPVTHVRFRIYPDGGVSRLRLWGRPAGDADFGSEGGAG